MLSLQLFPVTDHMTAQAQTELESVMLVTGTEQREQRIKQAWMTAGFAQFATAR